MSARSDLGPELPPRAAVYAQARELLVLANRALEFAGTGRTHDLPKALVQFERMRAVLGGGTADG